MNTILFLAAWALRSSILILCGALLLRVLRVKDPAVRLGAWTAMMLGSLMIPVIVVGLPPVRMPVTQAVATSIAEPYLVYGTVAHSAATVEYQTPVESKPFDWPRTGAIFYFAIALTFLLRLAVGVAMSIRLIRRSRATGQNTDGIAIRESERVTAPVTLGVVRPVIVLPLDWREWDRAKLDAILAHERSHIRRFDPAVQLLSSIHRALLWFSPLSWFLHSRIVQVAEEASDDAALAVIDSRTSYAEVLLDFMQRGAPMRRTFWTGVPMARYGQPATRIHRILDLTSISQGLTRRSIVVILALALPVTYLVASTRASFIEPRLAAFPKSAPPPVIVAQTQLPAPKPQTQPIPQPANPVRLQFDAASIRALEIVGRNGPVQIMPRRVSGENVTVYRMILAAYHLNEYQLSRTSPGWLDSETFALEGKSETANENQLRLMLRSLLSDRLKLAVHTKTAEMPVYALTVGTKGTTLREWHEGDAVPQRVGSPDSGQGALSHRTMKSFVEMLNLAGINERFGIGRPVLDETGLTGSYLFNYWFDSPADFQTAVIEDQLGLKLAPRKLPVEMLVIDHVERPSEN